MGWTCVVPVKAGPERKSRLAPTLDARQRLALSNQLYRHVVQCISNSGIAEAIIALSPALPEADVPVQLWVQEDRDLNVELGRVRDATAGPLMVINADLPLLQPHDVAALAEAAEMQGCAVAPDRHQSGTNAVALIPDVPFAFSFGPDSLRLHLASADRGAWAVGSIGFAYDVDTWADIEAILALGMPLPPDVARLFPSAGDKGARAALVVGD